MSVEAILTFIHIVSDVLCSSTGFQADNELIFLGCNEAEVIFLGCLKISWTDPPPVCRCAECPPWAQISRKFLRFANSIVFALRKSDFTLFDKRRGVDT